MLTERFSQDSFDTYFNKQHFLGAFKDNLSLYNFAYVNTIQDEKLFKPIETGNVQDENINSETDKEPVQCWKIYKQNNLCYLQKTP